MSDNTATNAAGHMMSRRRLRELLAEYDLEGLIAGGAPRDEYDGEARALYDRLRATIPSHEIHGVIVEVFAGMFDRQPEYGPTSELARAIWFAMVGLVDEDRLRSDLTAMLPAAVRPRSDRA